MEQNRVVVLGCACTSISSPFCLCGCPSPAHTCPPPACKQSRVVVLGGAFNVNGNVNPAAEANIFGDPDAANVVFSRCNGGAE